ncbi:unnamed protein product [Larinioides sclopetarius]|uniref:Cuticle protein n=1 Tax=Larinioides sclopetarius TaxID=280406 RepID=A0AAV2AUM8_9ARAC
MFAKVLIICIAFTAARSSLIAPIGYNAPIHSAGLLGVGKGLFAAPAVATVSSPKAVINHVAPSNRIATASVPVALSSHGILPNRLIDGYGIGSAPLAIGAGIYGAPVGHLGLGHGVAVSSQKSVISHVAPGAPVALTNYGIYGNGIVTNNGLLANGLVDGHRVAVSPLAIGDGLLGAPVALGHGTAVSSQKSVISHVAPEAHVAIAAAPVSLAHNGVFSNGLVSGHGIVGNSLIFGAPLGISGHGISSFPLSIGSGIHGAPIALSLRKTIL